MYIELIAEIEQLFPEKTILNMVNCYHRVYKSTCNNAELEVSESSVSA